MVGAGDLYLLGVGALLAGFLLMDLALGQILRGVVDLEKLLLAQGLGRGGLLLLSLVILFDAWLRLANNLLE